MPLNYRTVDLTRFGIGCKDTDRSDFNLLQSLITERDNQFPSFLSGQPFILVLTLFGDNRKDVYDGNDCTLMKSSLQWDDCDANNPTSYTHAVPLTLDIINRAITWLRGTRGTNAVAGSVESVQDGLFSYFNLLRDMIPLQKPNCDYKGALEGALEFFTSHEWGNSSEVDKIIADI
jgi:hypothetical protein